MLPAITPARRVAGFTRLAPRDGSLIGHASLVGPLA